MLSVFWSGAFRCVCVTETLRETAKKKQEHTMQAPVNQLNINFMTVQLEKDLTSMACSERLQEKASSI